MNSAKLMTLQELVTYEIFSIQKVTKNDDF